MSYLTTSGWSIHNVTPVWWYGINIFKINLSLHAPMPSLHWHAQYFSFIVSILLCLLVPYTLDSSVCLHCLAERNIKWYSAYWQSLLSRCQNNCFINFQLLICFLTTFTIIHLDYQLPCMSAELRLGISKVQYNLFSVCK